MHRVGLTKQSCDCARVRARAPAPARPRISDHSGPGDSIAVRSVAELREHVSRRAETLGHWRLRWRVSLARGSHLRQRPSRAAHRPRLHQHRTKRAQARRSTVDLGRGDSNINLEAPPPLGRPRLHNRTRLDVGQAQVSEMLADSAIAAAFPIRDRGPCALGRAESQPGADLEPTRTPHRPPRQGVPCGRITELSTRQFRCARGPRPSMHVRRLLDRSLRRLSLPRAFRESLTNSGIACRNARALALQRREAHW